MLEGLLRRQEAAGLPAEELTAQQVRGLEPALAETVQVGIYLSDDHHVDNRVLMKALVTAAMRRGVEFLTGTPVIGLAWDDGRMVGVRTPGHTLVSGIVINAAGCWAGLVDQTHNLQIPTKPVRGQIVQLQQSRQSLHHLIHWADSYLVPWPDGRTLVGSTLENVGYNKSVTAGGIRQLLDAALKIAPPLQHATVQETWAGLRPGTPDDLPILGQSRVPNLVIAAGHFRNGILLAPITAKLIAELILTGNPSIPLDSFSPERFDEQ
jgi:glycine oxidase